MNLTDFLQQTDLEDSFVVGYYGGTNYGDELLLETLQVMLSQNGVRRAKIYYSNPALFSTYHHSFGYAVISSKRMDIFKALLASRSVVVGGGGIWGLDANLTVFFFSLMLCAARILGKPVYLLGVGYYGSTNALGRLSARLAGWAAVEIFARDEETRRNFLKHNSRTRLDQDISLYLPGLDLAPYTTEARGLVAQLHLDDPRVLVGVRRFKEAQRNAYADSITSLVAHDTSTNFTLMLFEHKKAAPREFSYMEDIAKNNPRCKIAHFACNPLALYAAFGLASHTLALIAPQYHAQISAYLCGVPFFPLSYDRKNSEFLDSRNIDYHDIRSMTPASLEAFVDKSRTVWNLK